jgi:mono/diheme cytochrome c family protein
VKRFMCFVVSTVLMLFAATLAASDPGRSTAQSIAHGKPLFNRSCSGCHDTVGSTTKSGPSLKGYYHRMPRPSDASVRGIIQNGKGAMPPFSTLDKAKLDDLVQYLRTL